MKKKLIQLGSNILRASRNELYISMRFLDMALSSLSYEMNLSTMQVGTDGEKILFNPRYLTQLYQNDNILVNRTYLHMILHCVFRHMLHRNGRQEEYWNLACDIAIESMVDSLDNKAVKLVVSDLRNEMYDKLHKELKVLTAEGIYRQLIAMGLSEIEFQRIVTEFYVDDHCFWDTEEKKKDQDSQSDNENESQEQEDQRQRQQKRESLQEKWEQISEKMQTNIETLSKEIGEDAGDLLQYIQIENRQRYDYAAFLRKFTTYREDIRLDEETFDTIFYTYGLQMYGNMPLIEALEYKEVKKVEELAIVIDTSESCADGLVQAFLEETYAILRDGNSFFRKMNIHIIQCDVKVQSDIKITTEDELKACMEHFALKGNGGTDFRPAFTYVDQLVEEKAFQNLKGLLYFTDGYGEFPQKRPKYDTAFIFFQEEYTDINVPPWAMKLILGPEDMPSIKKEEGHGVLSSSAPY